jgi:class 3 adenylate cyclase
VTEVQYARAADGTHVAYRVLDATPGGDEARNIVMVPGGLFPVEMFEEEPGFARLLDGLRALGRVILFDRRGLGLSDPIAAWDRPIAEQWAEDLRAVVDTADLRDVVIVSWEGFGIWSRFVPTCPAALAMLVLYEPIVVPHDEWDEWAAERLRQVHANMSGEEDILEQIAPSVVSDRSFREWYGRSGRTGASPATAKRIWESVFSAPPRDLLPGEINVPTLVLHRRDNAYACDNVLELAAVQIPGATLVELDGRDHFPFVGDVDALLAEIAAFVTGERRLPPPQRLLSAVLFTDLVGSTERAASLGDAGWKAVLDRHDAVVRAVVGRSGGTVVKTTGDGVLALVPSASVCVRAAISVRDELAAEGLDVRIGAHVGDVDRRGEDVSGLAVNIASRAMAIAGAGELVVTASVVAAAAGQASTFESIGARELKGVPGTWELFRLVES